MKLDTYIAIQSSKWRRIWSKPSVKPLGSIIGSDRLTGVMYYVRQSAAAAFYRLMRRQIAIPFHFLRLMRTFRCACVDGRMQPMHFKRDADLEPVTSQICDVRWRHRYVTSRWRHDMSSSSSWSTLIGRERPFSSGRFVAAPTGGAMVGLGVRISPLFDNMGLLIRPNFHRNNGGGEESFWWFDSTESLKF